MCPPSWVSSVDPVENVVASPSAYEPPALIEIGSIAQLTLNGCYWGKELGGTDGWTFMGINVPVSNCSS